MLSFTMIEVMIWVLFICMLIMFEIPQIIYRGIRDLIYRFNKPHSIRPKICFHCGDTLSIIPFRVKKSKDNKIVWSKYKCFRCLTIHKVMK